MTAWAHVLLGVIALATLVMAIVQVGVIVYAARLARRMERLADSVQQDVRPLLARATVMADDAARATTAAAAQVERLDRFAADLSRRVDETVTLVQQAIVAPMREGAALFSAIRSVVAVLRGLRPRGGRRAEDEDALFIG